MVGISVIMTFTDLCKDVVFEVIVTLIPLVQKQQ
jgi:hypothetical protein